MGCHEAALAPLPSPPPGTAGSLPLRPGSRPGRALPGQGLPSAGTEGKARHRPPLGPPGEGSLPWKQSCGQGEIIESSNGLSWKSPSKIAWSNPQRWRPPQSAGMAVAPSSASSTSPQMALPGTQPTASLPSHPGTWPLFTWC